MDEAKYIDLLITNRDFNLNTGHEPIVCNNHVSIGQDCVHAIIESGLTTKLIAERSPTLRADIMTQIIILIEDDERIIPGTVELSEETQTRLWITAETYDFGRIQVSADYDD
ncbi:DUF2590 family protein [Brenneria corticis]|uniref:DUF2590 domain-containing protein n=1 Tax=Brenneria corticis TaxID=2173106 RepID=A0A2U1U996_9GAMM|nr:DUF2590 family protein [Brenneria sp. CFCC 11842]PWC18246.1 DUF2590 domain-containing protein [Brenneria sp. CFCC 11842]